MYEKEKELLKNQNSFSVDDLRLIIKILRSDGGCPWDREQTHKSIIPEFIEETYEAVEAIEAENPEMLCEELGDVMLQVVFHTQIEEENGTFGFDDAVNGICRKMIVRHPHVFGDIKAENSEAVLKNWDKIKAETKNQETLNEKLSSVAKTLPALVRMQKVIHKILKETSLPVPDVSAQLSEKELEAGKKLCRVLEECDALGIDAETALRRYCDGVIRKI